MLSNRISKISKTVPILYPLNFLNYSSQTKKYSSRHTNTITTALSLQKSFQQYRTEKESGLNPAYALLTNSQKKAAKNYLRQVFGNIGLKGGSLSPSVLTESELKRSSKLVLLRGEASESVPHFQTYIT